MEFRRVNSVQVLLQNFRKSLKLTGNKAEDGFTCLKTECNICNHPENKPNAFVNKKTGTFLCPTCDFTAPLEFISHIYSTDNSSIDIPKNFFKKNFKSNFILPQHSTVNQNNVNLSDIVKKKMGLNLETSVIHSLGLKYNTETNLINLPLKNMHGRIVGEKYYNLYDKKEDTYPLRNCSGLVMYSRSLQPPSKAILVLNVLDFFALVSAKLHDYTIICLPYKTHSLPQECLPLLEKYKELVIWFDIDTIGWDVARNFAQKLNSKRCLYIRPTDNQITPYEALKNKINLNSVLRLAQPVEHKYITTFALIKDEILSDIQNIEKVNGVQWRRFPILNNILKGHRKGELTILTGPTGCGKTTFISEYSLDLAQQGVSTLWGSFEIRTTRLAATLLRQFVGHPLDEKLEEFEEWACKFEQFPIYFMTFYGQQSIRLVMDAIEHAQYVHDIQHVIIDNVQFMMGVSETSKVDKYWEQDAIIAAFRRFATLKNVHVTLVIHPRKEKTDESLTTSSIFGNARASQEADNVLIIQDKRMASIRGKKFLQIVKNRYAGELGIVPLIFDKSSHCFSKKQNSADNPE